MAQVTVTIAGRVYRMACGEGEEAHLENLARAVDAKIGDLRGTFGEIGDQRIIVMAALTFADDLSEARRRIAELEADAINLRSDHENFQDRGESWSRGIAEALGSVASRIEKVAQDINGGRGG